MIIDVFCKYLSDHFSLKKVNGLFKYLMFSALTVEASEPALWVVLFFSLIISLKGQLVIDRLMGLRHATPAIRYTMLSYFYLLPLLIIWALIFPEQLAWLTTL